MKEPELDYWYPHEWVAEYRLTGTVRRWRDDYPHLFDGSRGTIKPFPDNSTSNLSTYALMYLLRRDEGVESLTYFRLTAQRPSIDGRREALQRDLRRWMGDDVFERLRSVIRGADLTKQGFEGEPDLFCWNPTNGEWFFAEAKGNDKLTGTQLRWFAACRAALPNVRIRVCRVRPLAVGQTHGSRSSGTTDAK